MSLLPPNLDPAADVAVVHVTTGATAHLPAGPITRCGKPMWGMQRPLPSAAHMATLSAQWCGLCFVRENQWVSMLAAAHPDRPNMGRFDVKDRRDFAPLNAGQHRRHGRIYALLHRGRPA